MKRTKRTAVGLVAAAGLAAGNVQAQDSAHRDEALAYSQAILSAWTVLEGHIRGRSTGVTLIDGLTSTSALTAMGWQASWTERGLAARYCSDMLVVFAEDDELKGVGEDHRAVQVAPAPGLQRIFGGSAVGTAGRETVTLPACLSGLPDGHVALAAGVLDPWVHTDVRVTWEQRTVACVAPDTGPGRRERRELPIQVNGRGQDMALWPADCAGRAAGTYTLNGVTVSLPAEGQCGAWELVFDDCITQVAVPNWQFRNVDYGRSGSGSCPSGYSGSASWTQQWERREMNRNDGAGWVVTARRQKPGTSTQWSYSCSRSGTGSCPPGQTGAATWTQTYGQARVWNYGGCTTPPPAPIPTPPTPPKPTPPKPTPPTPTPPPQNPLPQNPPSQSPTQNPPDNGDPGGEGPGDEGPGDGPTSTDPGVLEQDTVSDPNFGGPVSAPSAPADSGDQGNGDGGDGGKPIVLDLDGDGVELVPLEESTAFFDINGDGYRTRMAWAAADDGFLAYDKDGDGAISAHDELSFISYVEHAATDLEGLRHFDTDGDGQLDPDDADWDMFRVWRDLDQDGESDPGELHTLDAAGITSIGLTSDAVKRLAAGSIVHGEGVYAGPHGLRAFWDVSLRIGERKE